MDFFAWRVAAEQLGGFFVQDPGAPHDCTLEVTVHGVDIVGKAEINTTSFRAQVTGPRGLHLHVLHRSRYGHIRLGTHDFPHLPLGQFRVDANDRDYAALWLTRELCERLQTVGPSRYEFELRDETAIAMAPAFHERRPQALIDALHALAAFANRSREIDQSWGRCVTAIGGRTVTESWRPTGSTSAVIPQAGETVRLDVFVGGGGGPELFGLHTRVRVERRTTGPLDFYLLQPAPTPRIEAHLPAQLRSIAISGLANYAVSCSAFTPTMRRLQPAVCRALEALSPSLVVGGVRDVQVYMRGFVADPARLRAAARLCVELAVDGEGAARGPYR